MLAALRLERDPAILGSVTLFSLLRNSGPGPRLRLPLRLRSTPPRAGWVGKSAMKTAFRSSGRGAWLRSTYMAESA